MSIRARSRALRSISPGSRSGVFIFGRRFEVSVALKESRADFPGVSLRLSDPSEWRLAAYSAFFSRKTT